MKKVLAVMMAVVMMVCFAACGEQKQSGGETEAKAFKIGATGPLTGPAAIYGQAVENAAKIAVEEVNALGGLQIEFKMEDDTHDAEKAVNAYNALKDWGMQAFMGSVTTAPSRSTSAEANTDGMFFLTPSASAVDVVEGKDNCFQMCFTDPNQGIASADFMAANMAGSKVAIIYNNQDIYSTGIRDKFVEEAAVKGVEVVFEATFTDTTQTDFSVQVEGAKAAGADVVFLPIYYTPAGAIMTEAAKQEFAPTWFGVDGLDGILTLDGFDTSLAEGAYLLSPFSADADDDATRNFVAKYKEKYGVVPNQFAADAYDCIYAMYQALTNAGTAADASAQDVCADMVAQFTSMQFEGLTGGGAAMTWGKDGMVSKAPYAVIIQNGEYVGF